MKLKAFGWASNRKLSGLVNMMFTNPRGPPIFQKPTEEDRQHLEKTPTYVDIRNKKFWLRLQLGVTRLGWLQIAERGDVHSHETDIVRKTVIQGEFLDLGQHFIEHLRGRELDAPAHGAGQHLMRIKLLVQTFHFI